MFNLFRTFRKHSSVILYELYREGLCALIYSNVFKDNQMHIYYLHQLMKLNSTMINSAVFILQLTENMFKRSNSYIMGFFS